MNTLQQRIAVVITHHLNECDEFVSLATHSVAAQGLGIRSWVISDAPRPPPGVVGQLHHDPDVGPASSKLVFAMEKLVPPSCSHVLWMSDDVMLTANFFEPFEPFLDHPMILNPASNQDEGFRYNLHKALRVGDRLFPLGPNPDWPTLRPHALELFAGPLPRPNPGPSPILWQAWVPFFCTLMPRVVYEAVGRLNRALEYRHNDEEYCARAAGLGFRTGVVMNAYALHFGSQTISRMPEVAAEQEAASRVFFAGGSGR